MPQAEPDEMSMSDSPVHRDLPENTALNLPPGEIPTTTSPSRLRPIGTQLCEYLLYGVSMNFYPKVNYVCFEEMNIFRPSGAS